MSPDLHSHAKLAAIIGDPHAEEAKWMAACVAVGDRSLVKDERGSNSKVLLPLARGVARRLIALNVLFSWGIILMLAQQLSLIFGGPGNLWINDHMGIGPGLGMLVSFFGSLGFWRAFTGVKNNKFMVAFWLGLATAAMGVGFMHLQPLHMILPVVVSTAGFWGMAKLATYARNTLPPTFRCDRTTILCGMASAPCALLMLLAIGIGLSHPGSSASEITGINPFYLSMIGFTSLVSMVVPAYVCTRVSRSASVAPSIALNAIYSAPLLTGLLLATIATTFTLDPTNISGSLLYIAAMWTAGLSPFALVAGGAYLGSKRNAGVQRRALERGGGTLLIGQ